MTENNIDWVWHTLHTLWMATTIIDKLSKHTVRRQHTYTTK
jgi:hypothetical protein